jgi:hypothetical protein
MFSGIIRRSLAGAALALVLVTAFICTPTAPLVTGTSRAPDYLILNPEGE